MYKQIVIATDGSELAHKGVVHGLKLAKALNAKATVVTVTEPWTAVVSGEMAMAFPIEEYEKGAAQNAEVILAAVRKEAEKLEFACATEHVSDSYPAEGLINKARDLNADLIVMASHGRRGLPRMILGSQAANVLSHSAIPVLIVR